jgi:hypothetical protein
MQETKGFWNWPRFLQFILHSFYISYIYIFPIFLYFLYFYISIFLSCYVSTFMCSHVPTFLHDLCLPGCSSTVTLMHRRSDILKFLYFYISVFLYFCISVFLYFYISVSLPSCFVIFLVELSIKVSRVRMLHRLRIWWAKTPAMFPYFYFSIFLYFTEW